MKKTTPIPKGKEITGDISHALDSRFLNSIVLMAAIEKAGTKHITVEIDRVEYHAELKYENGKIDKDAYLIHFKGSKKPLKLNNNNLKRVINLHGTVADKWHGKKVCLGLEIDRRPDTGQKGPCVRVLTLDPETGKSPEAW